MLFLTLDVEAPSIGDHCFTQQARRPFSSGWSLFFFSFLPSEVLEFQAWCRRRGKKTQMLGLELSGLIG